MRSLIFFLVILSMLGGGAYMVSQKMGIMIGSDLIDGKVAPSGEWHNKLIGVWKFNTRISNPRELWVFYGTVEYQPNGKFIRRVTAKYYKDYYSSEPEESDDDLGIVAGGTVEGKWKVDSIAGNWQETPTSCLLVNSIVENGFNEKYDPCVWFKINDTATYGNDVSAYLQSKVKVFSSDKILIEGEGFSDEGKNTWRFLRVE